MLLTLVAAGLAAGCSDDEDPLKDWTGPSKPGTEIKTPAEVGNRVVAHRGGSTEAGTRQFPDNSVAALNYAIGLGCYASECDIYLTKDDDVVVAHASAGCYINNLNSTRGSRSTGTCSARSITSRSTTSTSTAMRAATAPTTRNVSKASATPITIPTGIRSSKSSTRKICARASTRRSQPSRPNAARSFR